jgi:hypothetical protein
MAMLHIEEPFHGAVLNHRHGVQDGTGLTITVSGSAPGYGAVTVNGQPAKVANGRFTAQATITELEQDIVAEYNGTFGAQRHVVRVVWDRNSRPRYRFSIDDNSFWLRDVCRHDYASLFDCFYLDILRNLNREYGAKFTLNIYSKTDDQPDQPFELIEFSEKYKGEFIENSDWMVLAFHAKSNKPDRPYQYAPAEQLIADKHMVEEQILRIAGPETLAQPTVIHWGMVQPAALKAMYDDGVRVLSGFANPAPHGYDVNYWLDDARSEYLWNNMLLKDFDSGLLFSRCDIVCNTTTVEQTAPTLQASFDNTAQAEIMDLFTHEQYFWPFYQVYLPDHAERLNAAIRWVAEHGYEPVFYHEGFLGI